MNGHQTGAHHLADTLEKAGVQYIFSLSGNQIMSVYDAAIDRPLKIIHTRHEAAAVHMADAWGRLTGTPGVALLTAGPGHLNAIGALYTAQMAESPMVLLSGHSPLAQQGQGAFQEVDQVAAAAPVVKAAWLVRDPASIASDLTRALHLASTGRPGPVHLSLPADVLEAEVVLPPEKAPAPNNPDLALVGTALDYLIAAERPLILAGPALCRSPHWHSVEKLARTVQAAALPMESPRGVDDPCLHYATTSLAQADLVLLAGKKLDFSLKFGQAPFFAPDCRFVQIDADASQLRAHPQVALHVHTVPGEFLNHLTAAALRRDWPAIPWADQVEQARRRTPDNWPALARQHPVHPIGICTALQPFLKDGATLVSDGGEFGQWVQAGLQCDHRLINGPAGSIGSALPMGLAACLARPDHPVFALMGDGTFGYHALEIDTALRYGVPLIVLVGHDARWNAEHQIQLNQFQGRTHGCDLLPTRYDQLTQALGGHGEYVETNAQLTPAIERALGSGKPACINIAIDGAAAPLFRD